MDSIDQSSYFDSYDDLKVHKLMLRDCKRMEAYAAATLGNRQYFQDKVVIDVGAGTGILSLFCAKAGAKRVYAVEATSNMIPIIYECAEANDVFDVIMVVEGDIDKVTDEIPEKVDVIISEWMGFYLLHESMIMSVLGARRFLKDDGYMFPQICNIYAALVEVPQYFKWDIIGIDMYPYGAHLRKDSQSEPKILEVSPDDLLSDPVLIYSFDCKTVKPEELNSIHGTFDFPLRRHGKYQGLCIWFDVSFPSGSTEAIKLSTDPYGPQTHWKQTVLVFDKEEVLNDGDTVTFDLHFIRAGRSYSIQCDEVGHSINCKCIKCTSKENIESSSVEVNPESMDHGVTIIHLKDLLCSEI